MLYKIWIEGWKATGGYSDAAYIGEIEAYDFITACNTVRYHNKYHFTPVRGKLLSDSDNYLVKNGVPTDWGCRLFDNEEDARKSFG